MTDHIKWTLNHLPPSEDSRLGIMSLENAAKARAFHRSFPQYAATPLTRLDGMARRLGLGGLWVKSPSASVSTPLRCWGAPSPLPGISPGSWDGMCRS